MSELNVRSLTILPYWRVHQRQTSALQEHKLAWFVVFASGAMVRGHLLVFWRFLATASDHIGWHHQIELCLCLTQNITILAVLSTCFKFWKAFRFASNSQGDLSFRTSCLLGHVWYEFCDECNHSQKSLQHLFIRWGSKLMNCFILGCIHFNSFWRKSVSQVVNFLNSQFQFFLIVLDWAFYMFEESYHCGFARLIPTLLLLIPSNVQSICFWNTSGALLIPYGSLRNISLPKGTANVQRQELSSSRLICQKAYEASITVKFLAPFYLRSYCFFRSRELKVFSFNCLVQDPWIHTNTYTAIWLFTVTDIPLSCFTTGRACCCCWLGLRQTQRHMSQQISLLEDHISLGF